MVARFWKPIFVLAANLALVATAGAQESPVSPTEPEPLVADPRAEYVVGFAQLSPIDLAPEHRYIASSLPLLIAASFDSGQSAGSGFSHTYQREELDAYSGTLIREQIGLATRSLSAAIRQRDLLVFESAVAADQRARRDEAVDQARSRLDELLALDPADVEIAPRKPIVFWDGRSRGRLLDPIALSQDLLPEPEALRAIIESANLDLLIWGTAQNIRGYLKVDFYAFSAYGADLRMPPAGTVALPADIAQDSRVIAGEVADVLLGRPWGSVRVTTNAIDAAIRVDGELIGYRAATAYYLDPGDVVLNVTADGYEDVSRDVTVAQRETTDIVVNLQPAGTRTVRLESAPADADVYVDSVWAGMTPLDLPVGDSPLIVRIRKDGYLESRLVLDPESPPRVARALLPDTINWAEELTEKRDGFYRAMTWFVLSVPVTIALNGVYQAVFGAFPPVDGGELTIENRLSFARTGNIFYWASGGGLLVNIGLLVNAGISLFEYLEVGEGGHNQ